MTTDDTKSNRNKAKSWFAVNKDEFKHSTEASEAFACEFDCYEDEVTYPIPEWVFEVALDYFDE